MKSPKGFILILFALIGALFQFGCEQSSIQSSTGYTLGELRIPNLSGTIQKPGMSAMSDDWTYADPANGSEINCIGVAITLPELDSYGLCRNQSNVTAFGYHLMAGPISYRRSLKLQIPVGSAREFRLMGYRAASANDCSQQVAGEPDRSKLSNPVLLGSVTSDIGVGTLSVDLAANLSSTTRLNDCSYWSSNPTFPTLPSTPPAPPVSATLSSIQASGTAVANGLDTISVTITLLDDAGIPVQGLVPTFSATDTGGTNAYGVCSASDATGASTCAFTSTKAESKTLSLVSPVALTGPTVSFVAGPVDASGSTITGSGPVVADGTSTSTVTVTLGDAFGNPIADETPVFSATDTGATNVYGSCSISNASGVSTCTLASTKAEVKTLSISSPVVKSGGTVTFISSAADATNSSIVGTSNIVADGSATSAVTITLLDVNSNPVVGETPTFNATNTGSGNSYGVCSASDSNGVSTCTLASTKAEVKTLAITAPVSKSGGTVTFVAGAASATTSTITGTSSIIADGAATSTVTITLLDANSNPIAGAVPTFSATDTGNTNDYGVCGSSNASGISTCTLTSRKAEVKTLSITSPISKSGGTVTFVAGAADSSGSTIVGSSNVVANGVATSTVTITLLDAFNNPVAGVIPDFSATDTGGSNSYGVCGSSNASGIATCTLASEKAEVKTLSITAPFSKAGGTVTFIPGPASASTSTIIGSGPVLADGTAISTITVTLLDAFSNPIAGVVPTFSATNTGSANTQTDCGTTDSNGQTTCTLKSTKAETKTLSLLTPVAMSGGSVLFTGGTPVEANSTITGTNFDADLIDESTVTITLRDQYGNGSPNVTPTFSATNTESANTYGACSTTGQDGVSTCTLKTSYPEAKTLSITSPFAKAGGTVTASSPGLDLTVPIEMIDRPIRSSGSDMTFERSRTYLDTADYDGSVSYYLDLILLRSGTAPTTKKIYLVDQNDVAITGSEITVNVANGQYTHMRSAAFALNSGTGNSYRLRVETASPGYIDITSARLLVNQVGATKTRIYFPLASLNGNETSSDVGATVGGTSNTAYTDLSFSSFKRQDSAFLYVSDSQPYTLDAMFGPTGTGGESASVALYKSTGEVVAGSEMTSTVRQGRMTASIAKTATNFVNDGLYTFRAKSSIGTSTAEVYKAGIWVKLDRLYKAEIPVRIATYRNGYISSTLNEHRHRLNLLEYSNPQVFLETDGSSVGSTSTISLYDTGSGAVASGSTQVSGSSLTLATSRSLQRNTGGSFASNMTSGNVFGLNILLGGTQVNLVRAFMIIGVQP